jgi:universal stress protein A
VAPLWRTLLVPTDFSECSDRALELAATLARIHDAKVVLLHASELTHGIAPSTLLRPDRAAIAVTAEELLRTSAHEQLRAQVARSGDGLSIEVRVALGRAEDCIARIADETRADLIVMGTHGRTGIAHALLGSVAERTLRSSRVPVLTVRKPDSSPHDHHTAAERELEDEASG